MDTKAAQRSAYSFFDSYRYLWGPQRPQRTVEEMKRLRGSIDAPAAEVLSFISFEDRVAIRSLFYVVVDDTNLRNLLDGLLLPPPYAFPDLHQKRWTQEDVRALCVVLNPSLDWVVVNLPFNLALRLGSYDARLRAAARRLSWILSIPFFLVEREENSLAQVHMTVSRDAAAEQADVARQEGLLKSKEQRKRSLTRVATIGGFSVLGGAALLVTGGLAAPVVGPAYAALVSATATTLGVIGAVGGAVLGTGALATVFATIVGAATHAAALTSVVTPVLTAANMTAIFGVTGASLGGYKAFRRTTDSDIFMLRSVDEVEAFETAAAPAAALATTAEEEEADLNKEVVHRLACSHQTVEKGSGASGTSWDLSVVLEDDSKPGVVVPLHTRMITMSHVRNLSPLQKRRRHVVFAVENNLDGFQLRLKAIKLISGVWAMAPPAVIAPARAGVFACVNRFAHPTGAGFIVCYMATPSPGTAKSTSLRIWVRAERDFFGAWALSAACEKTDLEFDPTVAENWMEGHLAGSDFTRRQWGVALEMHVEPYTYLKLYPANAGEAPQARKVTFPKEELPQRQLEYGQEVKQRRKLGVSLVNRSSHDVLTRDTGMVNGEQWPETPSPIGVYPAEASLTYFTNSEWSLAGAEGYYIVEVVNRSSRPVTPRFYVRAQFAVSSLNNVNVAFASAYNLSELTRQSLTPATPSRAEFSVDLPPGLFFSLTCVVDVAHNAVQLVFQDFVEQLGSAGVPATEKMTLAIGVSGYSAIFDSRRPVRDQQVGLWQPVLRRSELLGSTESYVLQWEDDLLMKFGETIHVNLEIAGTLMMKAVGTAAENTLMQGALFTGLHALSSLVGAFKLPLFAVWATGVIDNTFATLSNRSAYTGKDLAVALLDKQRGNRPVTLVGFSFGSLVIVECLRELERVEAYGVVENVYLLGCTCSSDPGLWHCLRRVVAGRLVNVYTREDWTLWMMYRLNKTDLKPMAGINPVNVPGVENVDVTPLVSAHGDFAVKLLPVLSAIPPEPTATTWSPRQHHGSPGVTVPVRKCGETVAAVCKSLHSYIKATAYVAVGVKNCVVSDIPHYEPQVELLTVQVYGCFFDFMPPPLTDTGMASVAGLLGDTEKPMGAVVAYRMRLPPSSPRDLLVALYLCSSAKGDLQVCAQPNLVERRSCDAETQEQAYQRLCGITAETCQTLDDVKRMCCTQGAEWELSGGAAHTQSILVPVPNTFDDAHQTAIVRLVLERLDSAGVTATWLALLTRASTQLQQETFDETQFKIAMAAIGTRHPHHEGDGNGMPLPVVAETCSTDNLQQRLHSLAAQLQDPATYPSNTAPYVLVNCGMSPLYFSETFHSAAKVAAVPDVPSCIWSMPHWRRFPPPEIPPRSFAVALLTVHDAEPGTHPAVPPVRYETNNGQCAFDVEFSDKIFTNGGAQGVADLAAAVHCTPVEGRPYLGEVTLSSTTIQTTPFIIIMMVPRTATDVAVDVEDGQDTVESRLRAHGCEDCSLAEFSRKHQLNPHTLWLPLRAALPSRAGAKSNVAVDPRTPIALLETATDTLLLDKRAICVKLQVANAVRCEETTVVVDPAAVPPGCEVFVRWSRPGGKKLRANTPVLHYDVENATNASARSAVSGLKRSRLTDNDSSVGASSLAGSLQGKQDRLSLVQQSTEDLQRRFSAAVGALGGQLNPRSMQILQSTLASMRHRQSQPPLHFVLPSDATVLEAAGVTWARSNRRILSRVFRSITSEERSEASKYSDGSRQLRFYFIEDVLLRRTRDWTAAAARRHADEDGKTGRGTPPEEVELLLKDEVLADMNTFAERGVRIVFLEHYPVLHHGSRYTVEQTLAPVVRLCRKGCPHLTVTVVLSAMSCVTAAQKRGLELSLVLPQAGLLTFFISELNTSLLPDPKTAAVVGSSDRGSEFLNKLHAEFARNASLTYVDEKELRRQR